MSADIVADSLIVIDYLYEYTCLIKSHQSRVPHWRAVDRCIDDHDQAVAYARPRLTRLEGRPIESVELEAAVVPCPLHPWEPPFPQQWGSYGPQDKDGTVAA